jgi:hypothetical protein
MNRDLDSGNGRKSNRWLRISCLTFGAAVVTVLTVPLSLAALPDVQFSEAAQALGTMFGGYFLAQLSSGLFAQHAAVVGAHLVVASVLAFASCVTGLLAVRRRPVVLFWLTPALVFLVLIISHVR